MIHAPQLKRKRKSLLLFKVTSHLCWFHCQLNYVVFLMVIEMMFLSLLNTTPEFMIYLFFFRQASWSMKCMKSAVQGCPSRQRNIFSLMVTRVAMTQNRLCGSRSCQIDMAAGCIKEADIVSEQLHENPDMAIFLCG